MAMVASVFLESPPPRQSMAPLRPLPVPKGQQATSPVASRSARPLPPTPEPVTCKVCRTCVTSSRVLLSPQSFPSGSRSIRGFFGRASLFTEIYNVVLSKPSVQLMTTGAHTIQEITCRTCSAYLGWKIVKAHESTERWKEGTCLLELEQLFTHQEIPPTSMSPNPAPGSILPTSLVISYS